MRLGGVLMQLGHWCCISCMQKNEGTQAAVATVAQCGQDFPSM